MFKKKKPASFSSRRSVRSRRRRPPGGERALREVSAGGIVFRQTPRGIQFAVMCDSYGKWTFPKGHVEKGERLEEAAARETLEELGLAQVRLIEYLGQIDIWFRDRFKKRGALVHKDIHYYLFEAPADAILRPDPKEHSYAARWVAARRLPVSSSYPDLVPILKRALSRVHRHLRR